MDLTYQQFIHRLMTINKYINQMSLKLQDHNMTHESSIHQHTALISIESE